MVFNEVVNAWVAKSKKPSECIFKECEDSKEHYLYSRNYCPEPHQQWWTRFNKLHKSHVKKIERLIKN